MALTTAPFGVTPFTSLINEFARPDPLFQDLMFDDLSKTWAPMATHRHWDLVETPLNYRFHCDLPGVRMEDIDITVKDDMLKVTAHRELTYTNQEVIGGGRAQKMTRWTKLPLNANQSNPIARYENGVLTVTFHKINQDSSPKKISLIR